MSLRELEYTHTHTFSVILSLELKVSTPPANRIIIYGNSGSLIGWINFHPFTCTGNIAICWEPDPWQRSPVFKSRAIETIQRRLQPGRVAQSVGHLTRKSGVLGSIPGLATYFCFSFRFFKKGSCQLLAKVCARSTG